MTQLLLRSSMRHMAGHPWQTLLSILGVALGVAVVFSIDLVNESAKTAFRISTDTVAGRTTHQLVGGAEGIQEDLYPRLRVDRAIRSVAPVVEGYVGFPGLPGRAFHLVGVDPLAEAPFRRNLLGEGGLPVAELARLLTVAGAVYLPRGLADEMGLQLGDRFPVHTSDRTSDIRLVGYLDPKLERGLSNFVLADIATAQELLGMSGRISRIDLIAPERGRDVFLRSLAEDLPAGVRILSSRSRTRQVEQMSAAFSQNLLALSLLALVVGMFLIYNAMTFSVVQRRAWMGDLRTLGVTRGEIYRLVLSEAALVAAVGTALGLLGGAALARLLLRMVTQTINDLYFVVSVERLEWNLPGLLGVGALGMGATLAAAAIPAVEAMRTPPRSVQNRSQLESQAHRSIPRLAFAGVALLLLGSATLLIETRSVLLTFAGLLPLIAGFALLTPAALLFLFGNRWGRQHQIFGWIARLASRSILSQLSRSGVAIAALAIAVGTTVGVTTMIDSFRQSVVDWLEDALDSDIYVSRPYLVASQNDGVLDPAMVRRLAALDGVAGANFLRGLRVETRRGVADLVALKLLPGGEEKYRYLEGSASSSWPRVVSGEAVLVSEPYAYRHGVAMGDSVVLHTAGGPRAFQIAGVYADYASDLGTVMIDLEVYEEAWGDPFVSGMGLRLREGVEAATVIERIQGMLSEGDEISIQTPSELRRNSMEIFDRTFAITQVLRALTVVVAFIGVLSALMALQFERERELGVLRALGLTPAQLWQLVVVQTGMMGLASGLLALPFGAMLALVLVEVVNKRSFGWSLQMHWNSAVFGQAVAVALVAALLAGLYPAYRMTRSSPLRALHEE